MKASATFSVQSKCSACEVRTKSHFCNFSPEARKAFEKICITRTFPAHGRVFSQGQPSDGVHLLCQGRAKLSICSKDGKNVILRVVNAGEVLGLSSVISDKAHNVSAEALEECQVNFVPKKDFLRFERQYPDAAQSVVAQLAKNYERACEQIRALTLSNSTTEKLARLFVTLLNGRKTPDRSGEIEMRFTHEEIGAMINTSRETVTRQIKLFRDIGLISIHGSRITINDIPRLVSLADEALMEQE